MRALCAARKPAVAGTSRRGRGAEFSRFLLRLLLCVLFLAAATAATEDAVSDWAAAKGGQLVHDASGRIVEADFRASWVTDSDLERLATMTDLRRVDLSHTRITDIGFERLKKLEKVEVVNLYFAGADRRWSFGSHEGLAATS